MSKQFYDTRKIFKEYINYERPLEYDEWMQLPDDFKAAHLYVQYFQQIIGAWYNTKTFYSVDEDGVEVVCQDLLKNVSKIEDEKGRYTAAYIYKVAYNCLYSLCRRKKGDYIHATLEQSHIVYDNDGNMVDIYDMVPEYDKAFEDVYDQKNTSKDFWNTIADKGSYVDDVVSAILSPKDYKNISIKERYAVKKELRSELEPFKDDFNF